MVFATEDPSCILAPLSPRSGAACPASVMYEDRGRRLFLRPRDIAAIQTLQAQEAAYQDMITRTERPLRVQDAQLQAPLRAYLKRLQWALVYTRAQLASHRVAAMSNAVRDEREGGDDPCMASCDPA